MNLVEFSKMELDRILNTCEEDDSKEIQQKINDDILQIVQIFSEQGHTGFTANYALNILERLLRYQPLSALTGEDDEWEDTSSFGSDQTSYQNKRCPFIFKDKDGKAYNTEGKIFSEDDGKTWFTSKDSKVYIEFPYTVPLAAERVILDNKEEV